MGTKSYTVALMQWEEKKLLITVRENLYHYYYIEFFSRNKNE